MMNKEELKARYKALILPESKDPYHFEMKEGIHPISAYNPMCGDKFRLFVENDEKTINQAHFDGIGCALSKASTSIMLREIEGKSREEIIGLVEDFIKAVNGKEYSSALSKELKTLAELRNFDGRIDCILLSWKALLQHLKTF